jgi:protein TonB
MLFLLSKEYATEGALISIRLRDGQASLVSDHVVGYDFIECSKYRGDLIALKREEDVLGNPYHLYWLYSPTGAELGLAGAADLNLDALRDDKCKDITERPPVPPHRAGTPPTDAIQVDESAMDRRIITRVDPRYPSQARTERIQGDVRLQLRIAADGTVQSVSPVSGPPQLVDAAVAAVKQWVYRPVTSSGQAVPVVTVVNVSFRLQDTERR